MAGIAGTTDAQIDPITQMLGAMPREELERLFLDFARSFAGALQPLQPPESEDRLRARVAAMTVREIAELLAPLVRIGEQMSDERRTRENRGPRTLNPARF